MKLGLFFFIISFSSANLLFGQFNDIEKKELTINFTSSQYLPNETNYPDWLNKIEINNGAFFLPRSNLSGEIEINGGLLTSSTASFFNKTSLLGEKYKDKYVARRITEACGIRSFVSENVNGIGFIQTYDLKVPNIKRLAISKSRTGKDYKVNNHSIYNDYYPLTRKLYVYLAYKNVDEIPNQVKEFLNIIFSKEGQTSIAYSGPFPLKSSSVKEARTLLKLP